MTFPVLPILSKVRTAESISGHIYIAIISYSHGRDLTGTSFQRDTITVLPVHRNSIHYTGYINIIAFYYDGTSTGGTEGSTCNGNQLAVFPIHDGCDRGRLVFYSANIDVRSEERRVGKELR